MARAPLSTGGSVQVAVRLPTHLLAVLDVEAARTGGTRSTVLRSLVERLAPRGTLPRPARAVRGVTPLERLQHARQFEPLPHSQVAEAVGVSPTTILRWSEGVDMAQETQAAVDMWLRARGY
jgi:hypothetical protein